MASSCTMCLQKHQLVKRWYISNLQTKLDLLPKTRINGSDHYNYYQLFATCVYTYILEMQRYINISPYRDTLSQ